MSKKLFVGSLSWDTTDEGLHEAFAQFGEITEAKVITEQEFESQRSDYANTQASLVKARTNKELRELQRYDVTIRATSAGTILTRNVEEGTVIQSASSNVSGGTALFVMADLNQVQIRVQQRDADLEAHRHGGAVHGLCRPGGGRGRDRKGQCHVR